MMDDFVAADTVNITALRDILEDLKKLRARWCAGEVDDSEDMLTEVPGFLAYAVPSMEAALGESYSIPPLEIINAKYGCDGYYVDVTTLLKEHGWSTYDRIRITISNTVFGDPAFGQIKELIVLYKLGGEERAIRAKEGEILVLGGKS